MTRKSPKCLQHRATLLKNLQRREPAAGKSGGSSRTTAFKQRAHEWMEQLPADAGWRELIYRATTRWGIEEGLDDSDAGRVKSVEDVVREFGLKARVTRRGSARWRN
jgi:hypothetical protein